MRATTITLGLMIILGIGWYWFQKPQAAKPPLSTASTQIEQSPTPIPANPAEKIGQLFMIGHWADQPVASTTALIERYGIGGVIIMSAPDNPAEIKEWVEEWQEVSASTLLIAIDQEGGPVSRLRGPGFTTVGQRDIPDTETAFMIGKTRGKELATLGINLNLAPVLDSAYNPDSFMYSRVFPERDESARLAAAMIAGMDTAGVTGVVKHFPGHDDTADDSHAVLPTVTITQTELDEFVSPFAELITNKTPRAIMTAHVAFPNIDPLPATLSPFWLTTYLRDTLHYTGVIITDDMIMDAIDQTWPHEEATVMALRAGADIILYAAEPEKVGDAIAEVTRILQSDHELESHLGESLRRIDSLKEYLR